jgi:hypothetical protein
MMFFILVLVGFASREKTKSDRWVDSLKWFIQINLNATRFFQK